MTPQLKDGKTVIPDEAISSVTKNFVALKGPLAVRVILRSLKYNYLLSLDAGW